MPNTSKVVIGGTGHVGNFLCDILEKNSHEVVISSRGTKKLPDKFRSLTCNSGDIESLKQIRTENFDAVIDFPGTAYNLFKAFAGYTNHIIGCGSVWMFGNPKVVPTPEIQQSEIFNVGSGTALTISELVKTYAKIYNSDIPIEYDSWQEYKTKIILSISSWQHFYAHMCPDISKATKKLGFKAKYSCEETMHRAVNWMRETGLL